MPKNSAQPMIQPVCIGSVRIDYPTVMAPMAGITDAPFRSMIKARGCGLVCSEMISASGLFHRAEKTHGMLGHGEAEKPFSVQLFGAKPEIMAHAAQMAEAAGADIIDINCGCAVKKIVKTGAGVGLMRDRQKAESLVRAVREAVTIPLTVKIRSGWDASGKDAVIIARAAQDAGADAVAVHPRTARQKFSGKADWRIIAAVKQAVSIPVIGNGDIRRAEDALHMMEDTGCDAVMIGRAAIGNPWIFVQVHALMRGGTFMEPDLEMRFSAIRQYVSDMVDCYGQTHACRIMRSRLGWLLKGLPQAGRCREALTRIAAPEDACAILADYQAWLSGRLQTTDSTNPMTKSAYA